jgi:hypothetical protein
MVLLHLGGKHMKYSEAGKGSTARKTDKEKFEENFEKIFGKKKIAKEIYYDSDETNNWDEDKIDIIGLNGNTGDHYIK